jgi:(p)ppGpp synthase/HD superfamily hydrolase
MRTVWALEPRKAAYLTRETLDVWCPQCEYLGLNAVKAELEDICFAVNDAETFKEMHRQREAMLAHMYSPDEPVRAPAALVTMAT